MTALLCAVWCLLALALIVIAALHDPQKNPDHPGRELEREGWAEHRSER